jgi:hypothetical protein
MVLRSRRRPAVPHLLAATAALFASCALLVAAQTEKSQDKARRPSFTLKATPSISFTPARVSVVGELRGGANDYEDYYCATVEWDWGDGTKSESTVDCDPYEAGKSEIQRRFSTRHVYNTSGQYRIQITLKQKTKVVAAASTTIQVQPGLRGGGP